MALQNVGGHIYYPAWPHNCLIMNPGGTVFVTSTIDADGEKIAFTFHVPKDGSIKKIGVFLGTVANTAGGVTISLQDLELTNGAPDGTADVSVTGVAVASDDFITGTFASALAVQAGRHMAAVVEFTSFSAGDSVVVQYLNCTGRTLFHHSAHAMLYTTSWAKDFTGVPSFYLEYDDGSVAMIEGVYPISSTTVGLALNTGTDPDEAGLYISSLPFPARCIGIWAALTLGGNSQVNLSLLNSADSVLGQFAANFDEDEGTQSGAGGIVCPFDAVTLSQGATYRVIFTPADATSSTLFYADVDAAAHLGMYSGGADCHWTQRTDAGAWSQTTTRRPMMGLILDQLDDGASGVGGSLLWGDRTGGLR